MATIFFQDLRLEPQPFLSAGFARLWFRGPYTTKNAPFPNFAASPPLSVCTAKKVITFSETNGE